MSGPPKQCYYELLQVDRKASSEEIRQAYKKQALIHHPDKNYSNEQSTIEKFKDIQNAYAVLSDPDERAWYDAHRESILNGEDADSSQHEVNLYCYFTSRCFDGFDDNEGGFYSVYRKVFDQLIEDESEYSSNAKTWPRFGDSATSWSSVSKFYSHWRNFSSCKTFAWKDEYKVNEIPDRASRRMAERINQKLRTSAKKEYVQIVQGLTRFVHRRDPRVAAELTRQEEERRLKEEEREKRELEWAKNRREANEKLWAEAAEKEAEEERARIERGEAPDSCTLDLLYEKQRQCEEARKVKGGTNCGFAMLEDEHEDNLPEKKRSCPACKKQFKTDAQYKEHVNSSKHKAKLRQLSAKGVDIETLMNEEKDISTCV
ncbi:chaperone protein DNAj, putative [Trypanosoma equiperdum]|uniref:Chaperone protein DNAJ, putative n=4 Tax=Trypanozoon TaxID=39700 RepID=Q582U2_TRYB2|nr:chaperone protein DNAj, putative [Trypanosoma brucei gambiense DAL972]XP_843823.1 chaperone protein DNAJ, putative [Trypanosoma brucei brucei TREU927]AAX80690.1 chaperone protein DNAJ, putative [Trypanosoma brucei]RHW73916.1 chaperone protein DNAj [Trypanosoma brucei equiperdum]SCU70643.1 chaperone protein DNAj, putative [Trypanosoma equiperdum]AAZ10264.1 chaperone protein DNAJ, putative [Trypanosoma brucei brucei TREU927]CBH09889.1 chaperone protein DNAj, putative [Trypanosoma brucei gamb|eukprot:XP_011772182.1 chaperone protein DNAj, putative [Trypanosoma brucei gambiense DAL972]